MPLGPIPMECLNAESTEETSEESWRAGLNEKELELLGVAFATVNHGCDGRVSLTGLRMACAELDDEEPPEAPVRTALGVRGKSTYKRMLGAVALLIEVGGLQRIGCLKPFVCCCVFQAGVANENAHEKKTLVTARIYSCPPILVNFSCGRLCTNLPSPASCIGLMPTVSGRSTAGRERVSNLRNVAAATPSKILFFFGLYWHGRKFRVQKSARVATVVLDLLRGGSCQHWQTSAGKSPGREHPTTDHVGRQERRACTESMEVTINS